MNKSALLAAALGLAAAPVFANPLAPLTNIIAGVPVAGPVVVNVISGLPLPSLPALPALPGLGGLPALPGLGGLPALPALPGLQGSVGVVLEGKGVIVGVNTADMPPVSVTPVGLPALPALPGLPF